MPKPARQNLNDKAQMTNKFQISKSKCQIKSKCLGVKTVSWSSWGSKLPGQGSGWAEDRRTVACGTGMADRRLRDSVNLAPVAYELNHDCLAFQSVDCSPVSYTKPECSFQCTGQRLGDDTLEVLRKPSEPSQDPSRYWAIKFFEVFCCSLSPLNINQPSLPPHHVEFCVKGFPGVFSVPV